MTRANRRYPNLITSPLAILLFAFCALALFYSLIIPLFEGPDEDDHFRYVKYLADYRALPVQQFEQGGGEAGHQGWQPPLYYALAAIFIAPIDTTDYSEHLIRNEFVTFVGDPACCGRNIYYHFSNENFPYTRTALAVHLARLLSIFFGAITVAATYALAKLLVENGQLPSVNDPNVFPLAVASVVAFNPSFLFASALVSNDTALAAFSSLTLLAWVKVIRDKTPLNLKSAAMLGALGAVAVLTKTTALALVPFTLLILVYVSARAYPPRMDFAAFGRSMIFALTIYFAPFVLLTFGWFIRNQMLYGDPLAARLAAVSALFPRAGELTLAELFQISLPQFWTTFWGGPTPSDFSPAILSVLAILTALAAVGVAFCTFRMTNHQFRIILFFLGTWLALLFFAMIQFVRTTQGGDQGRYLFPAISVFALFFVLGLVHLPIPNYVVRFIPRSIAIGSFLLALAVPFVYTLPAYARPTLLNPNAQARWSDAIRTNFANQIELLGSELDARSRRPGETLRVTLYWRALSQMPASYRVFVHLVGQNNASAGGVDAIPARGAFPTLYWKPNDALQDNYYLPIAKNAVPGKYSIEVGLYPVGKPGERLMTSTGDVRVIIGSTKVAPSELVADTPATRVAAVFADQIELLGYDAIVLQNKTRLLLHWRARSPLNHDYTVFVHALDPAGKIVAQLDQEPQGGNYPTTIWDAGEQVRDEYLLDVPSKNLRIELGLYRAETGERLPVVFNGQPSDHVEFNLGATP